MSGAPTDRFTPRLDMLPPAQRKLWPRLTPTDERGFVLYDGSTIALRLGHDTSVDFGFFTDRPLDKDALRAAIPCTAEATTIQDARDTWSVLVPGDRNREATVKLSFFGSLGFGRTGTPQYTRDGVLQVACAQDLPAIKLKVLLRRVEAHSCAPLQRYQSWFSLVLYDRPNARRDDETGEHARSQITALEAGRGSRKWPR